MKITVNNVDGPSFFFVSDNYTAFEIKGMIPKACLGFPDTISDPIPFNSTGNIQLGSVVQYYRGDSAAMVLQGYDDAMELPGWQDLMHNPPFPPHVSSPIWDCFNTSIGDAIPLVRGEIIPGWEIALSVVFSLLFLCLSFLLWHCVLKYYYRRLRILVHNTRVDRNGGNGDRGGGNDPEAGTIEDPMTSAVQRVDKGKGRSDNRGGGDSPKPGTIEDPEISEVRRGEDDIQQHQYYGYITRSPRAGSSRNP